MNLSFRPCTLQRAEKIKSSTQRHKAGCGGLRFLLHLVPPTVQAGPGSSSWGQQAQGAAQVSGTPGLDLSHALRAAFQASSWPAWLPTSRRECHSWAWCGLPAPPSHRLQSPPWGCGWPWSQLPGTLSAPPGSGPLPSTVILCQGTKASRSRAWTEPQLCCCVGGRLS